MKPGPDRPFRHLEKRRHLARVVASKAGEDHDEAQLLGQIVDRCEDPLAELTGRGQVFGFSPARGPRATDQRRTAQAPINKDTLIVGFAQDY